MEEEANQASLTQTQQYQSEQVVISQTVAILIDGNNIERSLKTLCGKDSAVLDFDTCIPRLLKGRSLNRLTYFREGLYISKPLESRLQRKYFGTVRPCHKSADIPLTIKAIQLADKVDSIIIISGDADYIELVKHLKGMGVRVEIAAVYGSAANALIQQADFFHKIKEHDSYIL